MTDINIVILRSQFGNNYILGDLFLNNEWIGKTLEYPWRQNEGWSENESVSYNYFKVSCIPAKRYRGFVRTDAGFLEDGSINPQRSGRFRIELDGTFPRAAIQIHEGKTLFGWSKGCILVGDHAHHNGSEMQFLSSNQCMRKLRSSILGSALNPSDWAKAMTRHLWVSILGMPQASAGNSIVV
jgi:hypothetical protein